MRFGPWRPLDGAAPPAGAGVLQARLDQGPRGLLDYPRGRSAMVYYDADEELARAVGRLAARAPTAERARVWIRFATDGKQPPREALAALLADFEARFGAPPAWNATPGTARSGP
jgi:hypothetical protein